jgi:hypothetical protein
LCFVQLWSVLTNRRAAASAASAATNLLFGKASSFSSSDSSSHTLHDEDDMTSLPDFGDRDQPFFDEEL